MDAPGSSRATTGMKSPAQYPTTDRGSLRSGSQRSVAVDGEPEAGRHDADHFARHPVELDDASDDAGVAAEFPLPQAVAEDGVAVTADGIFPCSERAAQLRGHAQNREEVRRDERGAQSDRLAAAGEIDLVAIRVPGDIHRSDLLAHLDERALRVGPGDADEALRRSVGQRFEQNSIHEAEDRRIGAQAERQSEHDDGAEARVLAKAARAIADVLKRGLQEAHSASIATALLCLIEPADLAQGLPPRLLRAHARVRALPDGFLQVIPQLLVQLLFHSPAPKERTQPKRNRVQPVFETHWPLTPASASRRA